MHISCPRENERKPCSSGDPSAVWAGQTNGVQGTGVRGRYAALSIASAGSIQNDLYMNWLGSLEQRVQDEDERSSGSASS